MALEILARLREALPPQVPLSLKMRRGIGESPQSGEQFWAIFDGAMALGLAAITVHGRTVRQRYEGPSSWDFVREVKAKAGKWIVFGSGDLFTPQDCLAMLAQTGVDGITVARGAIGNPWIFRQIRALAAGQPLPPPPDLREQRGDDRALPPGRGSLRAAAGVLGDVHRRDQILAAPPRAPAPRDAFAAVRRADQWWEVLEKWYAG